MANFAPAEIVGPNYNDHDNEFDANAFINVNENDFYKLLDVGRNTTKQEIPEAYKRRAKEFHPNKNTRDTAPIFQAIKSVYDTLCDEKTRIEYEANVDFNDDNEEDDEAQSTTKNTQMKLQVGEKLSDVYKKRIDRYVVEFDKCSFSNNFNEKISQIINSAIEKCSILTPVDSYVQCNICYQSSDNRHKHQRENCLIYEVMFDAQTTIPLLEHVIEPSIWNWAPVQRTSINLPIWNAHKNWKGLSNLIQYMANPLRTISQRERLWTSFIDQYVLNKTELIKLPNSLAQTTIIDYLPNMAEVTNLKAVFDEYDREESLGAFVKFQKNDERTTSDIYYMIDRNTKNKYIDKNEFYFTIKKPPSEITSAQCCDCGTSFTLFTRRHHCRMCGQQYCSDCLLCKRIPHLGFITKPVSICRKCSREKQHMTYQHIFIHVKKMVKSNQIKFLSEYLALLFEYHIDDNELFYRETGEHYYQCGHYNLALQCFTYAKLDHDQWFTYSVDLCKKNEHSFAFTCMKLCQKSDSFWLEQARQQQSIAFAILCYEHVSLSPERLFDIVCEYSSIDITECLLYLLYINIKYGNKISWKAFGEKALLQRNNGDLAAFCFHLHNAMQFEDWDDIGQQLYKSKKFNQLAHLLSFLYYVENIDLRTSKDNCIYFLTKILLANGANISLDDWLNDICNTTTPDICRIVTGLSIIHVYRYQSWIEYKNQYIGSKQYFKALLCHKMAEYINENNDSRWFINAIEDLDPVGFELLDGVRQPYDWKNTGDQYYKDGKFMIALNCYLFCDMKSADEIIMQQAKSPTLPLPLQLLFNTVVYQRTLSKTGKALPSSNSAICNNAFYDICIVLSKQHNVNVRALLTSFIKSYRINERFNSANLFKYHLLLLNELQKENDENGKNNRLINGGLHILLNFQNLSNDSIINLTALNRQLLKKLHTTVFNELRSATYKSCKELVQILLNPKNYFTQQLKLLLRQCLGKLKLSETEPTEYQSKLYLLQAMIFKLENKPVHALEAVHNALLAHPFDDVIDSLILFLNQPFFHSTIRLGLFKDIKNDSLNLININTPRQFMNTKFLKRTKLLNLLKNYERAIVNRIADKDPIQAAYSYIDLVMAISGRSTRFTDSFTMSCLYFYQAMTNKQCTLAELYAYRSIIFDMSVEIFLSTREYLPLYDQMYTYKLLYTIILRSSELFGRQIRATAQTQTITAEPIINDLHETVLQELLRGILQLSKVNPLTHVPSTSMIHDLVYMKCAGNELLSKYLKLMSINGSIYQYYFFEGVCKGWIDSEDFDSQRSLCMKHLLNDRDSTMSHVEDLLKWSLIPRTNDGWLMTNKHQLRLQEPAYAHVVGITLNYDTGDIEFMFRKAKKIEHNLFDVSDVTDVLRNGLTFASFTLDPPSVNYHSHPFNEMRYQPKRLSKAPNYLLTLLHADYLLKMISTSVEICSLQPFEMRSSEISIMQRLPPYIRDELKAIAIKKTRIITNSIHRFCIQPESVLEYEETSYRNIFGRQNENITQLYLNNDFKLCVKQYRMKFDEKGNLIDDENDNVSDDTTEAAFARVFTKYYDEIGEYFPELLRLKELIKLNFLSRIIQWRYESQREMVKQIEQNTDLDAFLANVKQKIGHYPTHSTETDETIIDSLTKSFCKQFYCTRTALKPYLLNWLSYNRQHELSDYLKRNVIQENTKLKSTIEALHFYHDDCRDGDAFDSELCPWVPATFSSEQNIRVYGGILLDTDIREKVGIKKEQDKQSITIINAWKLSSLSDKRKGKQETTEALCEKGNNPYIDASIRNRSIAIPFADKLKDMKIEIIAYFTATDYGPLRCEHDTVYKLDFEKIKIDQEYKSQLSFQNGHEANFFGGSYALVTSRNNVTVHRFYRGEAKESGRYWFLERQDASWRIRFDDPLLQEFNSIAHTIQFGIPPGIYFFVGIVAPCANALSDALQAFIPGNIVDTLIEYHKSNLDDQQRLYEKCLEAQKDYFTEYKKRYQEMVQQSS